MGGHGGMAPMQMGFVNGVPVMSMGGAGGPMMRMGGGSVPVMQMNNGRPAGEMTMIGGSTPLYNMGGRTTVQQGGSYNSLSRGGTTMVGGSTGPVTNEGGSVFVDRGTNRRL
ncbi:hypothetical protein MNEG_1982 [Monoraphidium neglectum]|jgi:hypothetical protein|uniref:Uncharacterized protein n=1 Tax=Monoraphidium neglectum TaxID=145388 RepID=A0A0D2LHK3_9CHLO|nr:hypothetical protein MNEG_1982 [Monoraphidium neglectum]KIZ05974.1 hypothetical protein MNEG_1982 [Monoraphidium neglectum]|eukprot:XP_013904993.1 hypothetical protein MNEG_1982 [Monoraphidium neglectum]